MAHRSFVTSSAIVLAASMLLLEQSASAQDALGGGNALDGNSQVGSGGRNTGRPTNPYAGRNSVVTGEVIGGREFRGRVGYTAPGDFRGSLGANALFRFRADSAWSSPEAFRGLGSSYEQLRFGQGLGVLELSRSGSGATPDLVMQAPGPVSFAGLAESRLRYDNAMLDATISSRISSAAQPVTLGVGMTADGRQVVISASSVRGLTLDPFNQQWESLGLSSYDQMRIREDLDSGAIGPGGPGDPKSTPDPAATQSPAALAADRVGQTFEARFENLRSDPDAASGARVDPTAPADYERILQNIADRYAKGGDREVEVDQAILKRLSDDYARVRDHLSGQSVSDAAPRSAIDPVSGQPLPTQSPSEQAPTASPNPGRPESERRDDTNRETLLPGQQPAEREQAPNLTQMGPVLRHGQKIESLSSEQQGRFNELMLAAEQQLRSGDYMLAEQRFQRALKIAPSHPMAMAGAANAQLGAGLYLPAGFTLRSLFTQHPAMIDTTFAQNLLPSVDRVSTAIDGLKARLEIGKDRSYLALALAYLGRQTGDRSLMEQGLTIMVEEQADDPLAALLRTVWLEGGEAVGGDPQK